MSGNIDEGYSSEQIQQMSVYDRFPKYSQIETDLYLGDLGTAIDLDKLKELNIKRILSVTLTEINERNKSEEIAYMSINVDDFESEDLISYFPECFRFIDDAVKNNENVLVHCMAGISRSATIVISYIMRKHCKPFDESLKLVREKRPFVFPNHGFTQQLKLYESMQYKVDANNKEYRLYLNEIFVRLIREENYLRTNNEINFDNAFKTYFQLLSKVDIDVDMNKGLVYTCVACDSRIFHEINVIANKTLDMNSLEISSCSVLIECTSIYIEPQEWMKKSFDGNSGASGVVNCYKCNLVLGKFDFSANGFSCNCLQHNNLKCLVFAIDEKAVKKGTLAKECCALS